MKLVKDVEVGMDEAAARGRKRGAARGGDQRARTADRLAAPGVPGAIRHVVPPPHALDPPWTTWTARPTSSTASAKISGKWAVVIGFDNKVLAGALAAGQPENILRATNRPKRLHVPLVWLVQLQGVNLPNQDKFYADRRGGGTPFFRHAELEQAGVPILAGSGAQSRRRRLPEHQPHHPLRPQGRQHGSRRRRHPERHVAPRGSSTWRRRQLIAAAQQFKASPGLRQPTHHDATGSSATCTTPSRRCSDGTQGVHERHAGLHPKFFRVAAPPKPRFPAEEIRTTSCPSTRRDVHTFDDVLARLVDGSEHMEHRPGDGPGLHRGWPSVDGVPRRGDRRPPGLSRRGLPRVRFLPGIGGKSDRAGADQDGRVRGALWPHRVPVIWSRRTTGIDVGDIAEKVVDVGWGNRSSTRSSRLSSDDARWCCARARSRPTT